MEEQHCGAFLSSGLPHASPDTMGNLVCRYKIYHHRFGETTRHRSRRRRHRLHHYRCRSWYKITERNYIAFYSHVKKVREEKQFKGSMCFFCSVGNSRKTAMLYGRHAVTRIDAKIAVKVWRTCTCSTAMKNVRDSRNHLVWFVPYQVSLGWLQRHVLFYLRNVCHFHKHDPNQSGRDKD